MYLGNVNLAAAATAPSVAASRPPAIRRWIASVPRPLRFLAVGGVGLATDLAVFTVLHLCSPQPLLARLISLALATLVTWRLNRALTFDRSHRQPVAEAARYAAVSAAAQAASYAVFAALVLTGLTRVPQAAVLAGAAVGAVLSYNGHRLFAFRPAKGPEPARSVEAALHAAPVVAPSLAASALERKAA